MKSHHRQTRKELIEKSRALWERAAKAIERAKDARRIAKARKNLAALLDRKAAFKLTGSGIQSLCVPEL